MKKIAQFLPLLALFTASLNACKEKKSPYDRELNAQEIRTVDSLYKASEADFKVLESAVNATYGKAVGYKGISMEDVHKIEMIAFKEQKKDFEIKHPDIGVEFDTAENKIFSFTTVNRAAVMLHARSIE